MQSPGYRCGPYSLFLLFSCSLVLLLLTTLEPSLAAEVRIQNQSYVIEGYIETGDYDRLEALVSSKGWYIHSVTIGSRGGDLHEAMKIGRPVRKMRFATTAPIVLEGEVHHSMKDPANAVCASACFYIYIAGVDRYGGVLGIHRPVLSDDDYRAMPIDDAIEGSRYVRKIISDYVAEMGVSNTYVDRIFAIPNHRIEWLEEEEVQNYFLHEIREVDDWLSARCPQFTPLEATAWYDKPWLGREPSDAEAKIIAQANDKFLAMENCKDHERMGMSCRAWVRAYSVGKRAGFRCSQYDEQWSSAGQ